MRKTVHLACAVALLLSLWVSGALAYCINNTTQVQPWYLTSPNGAYQNAASNPIQGAPHEFNTYWAKWNGSSQTLTILTDFSPLKDGLLGVTTADLFIDTNCDGTYDLAIGLDTNPKGLGLNRAGNVYSVASFLTSQSVFGSNGGVIYGGQVDPDSPHDIPVLANGSAIGTTDVIWMPLEGLPSYRLEINLTGLVGNNWNFIWGGGTCGNGPMEGHIPVPPSVLLLGSGLLGLGLVGRWRRLR